MLTVAWRFTWAFSFCNCQLVQSNESKFGRVPLKFQHAAGIAHLNSVLIHSTAEL